MRQEKTLLLDEIKNHLDTSNAFVVVSYSKLDANNAAEFRTQIAETGAKYYALKKRMLVKAAESLGVTIDLNTLEGHIAVLSTGENVVDAIKALYKFKKEKDDTLQVIVGQYEGTLRTPADLEQISKLPSKDEMRSQLLGMLEAVPSGLLSTMEALLTSVVYCLENKVNENQEAS